MLELWQRRQILAKSVLKPALDLLGKMKGEHEAAAAAAAMAANKMGQPLVPRRPLRLVMPYALLGSDTGLPTHSVCYPLDQWGSLAGFRYRLHLLLLQAYCLCFHAHPCSAMQLQAMLLLCRPAVMRSSNDMHSWSPASCIRATWCSTAKALKAVAYASSLL